MSTDAEETLPNRITIVGKGVPSSYEITVSNSIELVGAKPLEEATIVTEHAAEGTIETGVKRFRFAGEMANVHLVDWNGTPASQSPNTPEVHIDYGVFG
ncbi:hypothetical protein [Natronococcus sp. A-GB7]|uniref:hypothetical protein n=1 Tax=Natronococcus sp. A-GB7 TaxID=3037649 RepID=UPI00241DA1D4|nr:hypothetical protein [Natronococcus sp. A-GB7]MDG5821781.1 hypothetical protein [Natronococcus sp. A-GB7]